MPIEAELRTFADEARFCTRFLVPLLRRLGYSIVTEYHGQREFGKDLVFGEIDRFGEVSYHGLQAKYQESIGQSDSEKLIEDCRQAFRSPFQHPNTGAEQRICTFLVANAGNIADNARSNFFNAATNAEHGGNVRMFDGKALLALDRWATVSRVGDVGPILSGLAIEFRHNRLLMGFVAKRLRQCMADPASRLLVERLRTGATTHYIQRPVLPGDIDLKALTSYLHDVEGINKCMDLMAMTGDARV